MLQELQEKVQQCRELSNATCNDKLISQMERERKKIHAELTCLEKAALWCLFLYWYPRAILRWISMSQG